MDTVEGFRVEYWMDGQKCFLVDSLTQTNSIPVLIQFLDN